jgi:hypothetical protein
LALIFIKSIYELNIIIENLKVIDQ